MSVIRFPIVEKEVDKKREIDMETGDIVCLSGLKTVYYGGRVALKELNFCYQNGYI